MNFDNGVIRQFLRDELKEDSVFIDIGAHHGMFSVFSSVRCEKVYAVEPDPENLKTLNRQLEPFKNVEVKAFALSNEIGTVTFYHAASPGMHSIMKKGTQYKEAWVRGPSIEVPCNTIDNAFKDLDRIDVMKIDVEGAEHLCLMGGVELIKKHKPVILLETHRTADFEMLDEFLEKANYEALLIEPGNHQIQLNNLLPDKQYIMKAKK